MVVQKVKAADRQAAIQKIVGVLKKRYGSTQPKEHLGVLDSLVFAVCLENNHVQSALEVRERLHNGFHDLNEIRVSSISEIQIIFEGTEQPEWRSVRIRELLHYIFEKQYNFDMDFMLKKTLEQAEKILQQVSSMSLFVKHYGLMSSFGAHVFPVDERLSNALVWLGLTEPDAKLEETEAAMKSAVRKTDTPQVFHLLHELACDPVLMEIFVHTPDETQEHPDLGIAHKHLQELLADPSGFKKQKAKAAAASAKKATAKAAADAATAKAEAKKTPPKKAATEKTSVEKTSAVKSAPPKTAAKAAPAKANAKKQAPKKAPPKSTPVKKSKK